eukprot:3218164-Rhodomonas_salina.1
MAGTICTATGAHLGLLDHGHCPEVPPLLAGTAMRQISTRKAPNRVRESVRLSPSGSLRARHPGRSHAIMTETFRNAITSSEQAVTSQHQGQDVRVAL